ncbi:cell division-associated protein bimb [Phlyctema vagabunda]|uniref:separase n=1 Tax=Phlyctema vagabunda TaxID=108571 RepID=A0ABR4PXP0_9HELO
MDVQATAALVAPVSVLHTLAALLNSIAILLSAAGPIKGKSLGHPGLTSCFVESTRNTAMSRERKSVLADQQRGSTFDALSWPLLKKPESRRGSLSPPQDIPRLQRDYIDIIPETWTTISIALSDSREELSITKLQAGHSPFVLRLPLGRNNSIDADEEVFGFEQGHSELMEIIELANQSAHNGGSMTGREAKAAWWEEREGLDARLKDLLDNIEKVWLGGFKGIFSQAARRPDLLARFQKSFQNTLDKFLPSRQKVGRKAKSPRVTLDTRILDLFIGLGDASVEGTDLDEPLNDLLYFVVDILQFHGELNAYAEIDFDSIVIEIHDALRCYHEAVHASADSDENRHTILILDKALHSFPWESLPCMEGLAVSRLPSLASLRDRIEELEKDLPEDGPNGQYISRGHGAYILNPGGDLKSTQATFQKELQGLDGWDGVVKREPTEDEMRSSLENKELFLYFGHGSGAQYIRAREIRKMEKCAVTMLMGCSSGALVEAGEFEPYGPPINYMHAGCPALVATLWDVTDKDIDRFAKSTFEHWGLFADGSPAVPKGRGRKRVEVAEAKRSLVEAVARGKEACNLRYLNGAAVCVYGVPVYFK